MTTYTVQSKWQSEQGKLIKAAIVHLEYKDSQTSFYSSEWLTFEQPNQTQTWSVNPPNADAGQGFYSGEIAYVDGQTVSLPLTAIAEPTVFVGEVLPQLTVTVVPEALNWQEIEQVNLTLEAGSAKQSFTFSATATAAKAWSFIPPAGLEGYFWQATYKLKSGTSLVIPPTVATNSILSLPTLPPSYSVRVQIIPSYFNNLSVTSIEVTLISGLGAETTHSFTANNLEEWQATLYERLVSPGKTVKSFDYQYTVNFAQPEQPPYQSPLLANVLDTEIAIEEIGLIKFSAEEVDFDLITSIEVSYQLNSQPQSFTLNASSPVRILTAGKDYQPFEPFTYSLDYTLGKQGKYLQRELRKTSAALVIANPLTLKTVQIIGVGLTGDNPPIKEVDLSNLEYSESGQGWQLQGSLDSVTLQAETILATRAFPAVNPLNAALKYSGVIIKTSQEQIRIQPTYVTQTVVPVGDIYLWFGVQISPELVNWQIYREVELSIYNKTGDLKMNQSQLVFTPESSLGYWGYFLSSEGEVYYWQAIYIDQTGQPIPTPEKCSDSTILTLPAVPSEEKL